MQKMHGYGFNDKMEDPPPFFVRRWAPMVNEARLNSLYFRLANTQGFCGSNFKEKLEIMLSYYFLFHFCIYVLYC
jgi:hypothetical protein